MGTECSLAIANFFKVHIKIPAEINFDLFIVEMFEAAGPGEQLKTVCLCNVSTAQTLKVLKTSGEGKERFPSGEWSDVCKTVCSTIMSAYSKEIKFCESYYTGLQSESNGIR